MLSIEVKYEGFGQWYCCCNNRKVHLHLAEIGSWDPGECWVIGIQVVWHMDQTENCESNDTEENH